MRVLGRSAAILATVLCLAACTTTSTTEAPKPGPVADVAVPAPTERVDPPFAGLRTNDAVIQRIKGEEGLRLEAYQSSSGLLIGYGHGGEDVAPGMRITADKAEEILRADLLVIENEVKALVTTPLNAGELSALVDLVYTIGVGNFRTSTVLSELNVGNRAAAADAFLLWDRITLNGQRVVSQPLAARRQFERTLFLGESAPGAAS